MAPKARKADKQQPARARVDADELRGLYRQMLLIRRFEEKTAEMYQRARIGGYCHLNLGEEATCVGLCSGMQPNDYLFTNYREHGYALARGIDPAASWPSCSAARTASHAVEAARCTCSTWKNG